MKLSAKDRRSPHSVRACLDLTYLKEELVKMYPDFPRTVLVYTCSSIITNSTFLVSMVNDSHPNKKWHRPSVWGRGEERKDSHR